jgi:5-methylcytosine-specific restriction enzyme A
VNPSDTEFTAELIARRLGLPVQAVLCSEDRLVLTPLGIHENEGFSIDVRTGWRSAEVSFMPGKFARPLIEKMGEAGAEARLAFLALAASAAKQGKLTLRVNNRDMDALDLGAWPKQWQKFDLVLKKQGVFFEELQPTELKRLLGDIICPIFGMCISLIGIDDVDADASAHEGDHNEVVSRRYERRPVNREICLSLRGRRCFCCDLDFGETYGKGADGFIEVHHTTPVSQMGPAYIVNPATDLVPICSNCHSVVHLTIPPRSVDEVRALFHSQKTAR